ncbi:metallophosphoesterase [Ruegeria sp. HKCCA6837]|uniref:metallophosphoesterase n=1 Tax=Ruegeria sp. HKCCA6837 TaxID=2682989 RepID=UPI001487FB5D|nr:metallophosphoesterase [Ruegeria sp. HKCCA6837]
MGDIRYVCLSDMHFGADNSILTRLDATNGQVDPMHPSDVLIHLANCLRHLINENSRDRLPTLILNGDILDLAFSTENVAAMAFRHFLELTMPEDPAARLFDPEIVFIPGNHDHHLWETCRERQYAESLSSADWSNPLPRPPHITPMRDPQGVPSYFVNAITHSLPWLSETRIKTVYPNFAITSGNRLIVVSHGHFIEDAYLMVSEFADLLYPKTTPPETMEAWEAQNFAWIDFVWSVLGRSGHIGVDEENVYNTENSPKAIGSLLGSAARNLVLKKGGATGKTLANGVGEMVSALVTDYFERGQTDTLLSDDGAGVKRFMQIPVQEQIKSEFGPSVPSQVSLVFGHTHKPFESVMPLEHFFVPNFAAYNSGGWVVDSPEVKPLIGGAIVLIDEDANLASLRMYNEGHDTSDYRVSVQIAENQDEADNPLFAQLSKSVDSQKWPWSDFSKAAAVAVKQHNARLADFLKGKDSTGQG